jgi:hypothetical protein
MQAFDQDQLSLAGNSDGAPVFEWGIAPAPAAEDHDRNLGWCSEKAPETISATDGELKGFVLEMLAWLSESREPRAIAAKVLALVHSVAPDLLQRDSMQALADGLGMQRQGIHQVSKALEKRLGIVRQLTRPEADKQAMREAWRRRKQKTSPGANHREEQ